MGTDEVIKLIFGALGAMTLYIVKDLSSSVKHATKEISELNTKISLLIHRGDNNDRDIEKINRQIETIRERLHSLGNSINELHLTRTIDWVNPDHIGGVNNGSSKTRR